MPDVRPLYYAMWMFTEVTRDSSVIYETTFDTTVENMKAWVVKVSLFRHECRRLHRFACDEPRLLSRLTFPYWSFLLRFRIHQDDKGTVRVVFIHKSYSASDDCIVKVDVSKIVSSMPPSAMLYTLENTARSVYAT